MDPIAYADPADLSTADLGHQIAGLGGRINAATCRWLLLLAEFARREQWGDFPSCAAWLSWRCGIGPATAAEYVRVASALVHLPLVRARFAQGGLSYSQVRAVTRGVGYADEPELLSIADHATGAQLERIIRGLRTAITPREESARRERTGMTWFVDEEGFLVIRAKLDGEQAAIVHAALTAFNAPGADSTHSLVALAAAGLATGSEPSNRGPSADPAGGPTGTVVSVIATIDALVAAVDVVPVDGSSAEDPSTGAVTAPATAPAPTSGPTVAQVYFASTGAPASVPMLAQLLCDRQVRLIARIADGSLIDLGRSRRVPSPALRAAVLRRYGSTCAHPHCRSRRQLHLHHVIHWAHGGPTSAPNLVPLCERHHRGLHAGEFTIASRPDGRDTARGSTAFTFIDRWGNRLSAVATTPECSAHPRDLVRDPDYRVAEGIGRRVVDTPGRGHGPVDMGALVDAVVSARRSRGRTTSTVGRLD